MIYAISDLHGYPHARFLQLLKEAGFCEKDFLYILGDVIDRNGDGGVETLVWLMYQPNVELILGNHEASLLACSFMFDEIREDIEEKMTPDKLEMLYRYYMDGGETTMAAMQRLPKETQQDILDYLRDCPPYLVTGLGEKVFLLVHSGIEHFVKGKKLAEYDIDEFLWVRPALDEKYFDNVTTIFGHTPTYAYGEEYADKIINTGNWIDIDMGAGSGHEPVLLRLNDMKEFRLG